MPSLDGLVFSLERSEGGIVTVQLVHPAGLDPAQRDMLPTDDIAYLSVPPARKISVALVTAGNMFLREMLEGLNLSKLEVISPATAQTVLDSSRAAEFDVWILDRWLPTVKPGPGSAPGAKPAPGLPAGKFLVFGAMPPPPLGLIDRGPGEATVIVDWVRNHPTMRSVGLETLVINPGHLTELPEKSPAIVLARGQGGPAIIETGDEQTRALIVAFDITSSTWPFDAGFVLFTASSLSYLANNTAATATMYKPGDTIADRVPAAARNITLGLPDKGASGEVQRVSLSPGEDGRVVYGPVQRTGVYTLSWDGPAGPSDVIVSERPRRAMTANLLDANESAIATREKTELATGKVETTQGSASKGLRKLWPWLLMAALMIVLFEWWVYNRKVTF